jgi:hypothetical protein
MYNLTPTQQTLLRSIVEKVRAKKMPEEFTFIWGPDHQVAKSVKIFSKPLVSEYRGYAVWEIHPVMGLHVDHRAQLIR